MRAANVALILLALTPSLSQAIPVFDVESVACSGSLTSDISDVITMNCAGDFSLVGGTISADSKVLLSSFGAFTLDNLFITAPEISITAGSLLSLGSGTTLSAPGGSITLEANSMYISEGADITAAGSVTGGDTTPIVIGDPPIIMIPVPEANTLALLLAGLIALSWNFRARQGQNIIRGAANMLRLRFPRPSLEH